MRYFIVVGEASADLHASRLMQALAEQDAEALFAFMGGDLMAKVASSPPVIHYREVAFMGIGPVLRNLGTISRVAKQVQEAMVRFCPDVVIPVDFAGFNMRYILPFVKERLSCPIIYYIAPKIWAWQPWRITKLRKWVDHLLVILPFETEYFSSRGIATTYVGNPCIDATAEVRNLPPKQKAQIALLPGSRQQELKSNLPMMLQSVQPFAQSHHIAIAGAPGLCEAHYSPYLTDYPELNASLYFGQTYQLVAESAVALVTSGTATLETALLGTPQVVLYRMGGYRLARWIFDHLFSVSYISLVNLILGRGAIPELIGHEVSSHNIGLQLPSLLADETIERKAQLEAIQELRLILGSEPASPRAAYTIIQLLQR